MMKLTNISKVSYIKPLPKKNYVQLYKEFHALIVELAKNYCKKKPKCNNCPLKYHCNFKLTKGNNILK
jgi:endonuclease-3 related protein